MHKSQSLFNLTITLHISGVTITHLQEHKTTATIASGNHYTVIDRVKFRRIYIIQQLHFNLVYRYSLSVNLFLSITV